MRLLSSILKGTLSVRVRDVGDSALRHYELLSKLELTKPRKIIVTGYHGFAIQESASQEYQGSAAGDHSG